MKQAKRILQIIPAEGWKVVFTGPNGEFSAPLSLFALVEENGDTSVEGMTADGDCIFQFCEEFVSFVRYEGPEKNKTT